MKRSSENHIIEFKYEDRTFTYKSHYLRKADYPLHIILERRFGQKHIRPFAVQDGSLRCISSYPDLEELLETVPKKGAKRG